MVVKQKPYSGEDNAELMLTKASPLVRGGRGSTEIGVSGNWQRKKRGGKQKKVAAGTQNPSAGKGRRGGCQVKNVRCKQGQIKATKHGHIFEQKVGKKGLLGLNWRETMS